MNRFDRFCAKYNHFGIRNLMGLVLLGNAAVLIVSLIEQDWYSAVVFVPALVLEGEWWRIFTFILTSGQGMSIWIIFFFILYFWIGQTLERTWGRLKFTIYYFSGALFTILFGMGVTMFSNSLSGFVVLDATYLNLSLFLAFGTLFPDMELRLFFILPVKMKWLAILDAALLLLAMLTPPYSILSFTPLAALGNYLLFFGSTLYKAVARRAGRARSKSIPFQKTVRSTQKARGFIHQCSVCGVTDTDPVPPGETAPEFRYCSLCAGYKCYCSRHIFNHEHKS